MYSRVKSLLGDRRFRVGCLLLSVVIVNLAGTFLSYSAVQAEEPPEPVLSPVLPEEPETAELIVCIGGAVASPGVVRIPEGARLYEALEAAGGVREDADLSRVNLDMELEDSDMIRIPFRRDSEVTEETAVGAAGEPVVSGAGTDGKININRAGAEELMKLPGIGEQKASAILTYREQHGGFGSVEEIMQVSGIKQAGFDKIKEQITVR
jgi:competence protein ComEA